MQKTIEPELIDLYVYQTITNVQLYEEYKQSFEKIQNKRTAFVEQATTWNESVKHFNTSEVSKIVAIVVGLIFVLLLTLLIPVAMSLLIPAAIGLGIGVGVTFITSVALLIVYNEEKKAGHNLLMEHFDEGSTPDQIYRSVNNDRLTLQTEINFYNTGLNRLYFGRIQHSTMPRTEA